MTSHTRVALLCILILIDMASSARRSDNALCPSECYCNRINRIVYCSRRGLTSIPRRVPSGSTELNLSGNLFRESYVRRSNITDLATSLERVYMSECGLEQIEVGAFQDLTGLKWLDLSNNRIARIEDYTFRGLNLLHLFLNGNRNLRLATRAMQDMKTTGLQLHECSLNRLQYDVFAPLNGTLKFLWLNGNELQTIDSQFATLFASLTHLRLGENPLDCNCQTTWLKSFYDQHSDIFDGAEAPNCLTPSPLRAKLFDELTVDDFVCQAPVFNNIDAVIEQSRGLLTCRASGDPAPTLYWISPSGVSTKYEPTARSRSSYNEATLDITDRIISGEPFSGQYFCLAINDGGDRTFTFNVSWPSSSNNAIVTSSVNHDINNNQQPPVTARSKTAAPPHTTTVTDKIVVDDYFVDYENERVDLDTADLYNVNGKTDRAPPTSQTSQNSGGDGGGGGDTTSTERKSNQAIKRQLKTTGRFTLLEFVAAIVGTFACTLILCIIVIPLILRRLYSAKRHDYDTPVLRDEPVYMAPAHNCNPYSDKLAQQAYLKGYNTQEYHFEDKPLAQQFTQPYPDGYTTQEYRFNQPDRRASQLINHRQSIQGYGHEDTPVKDPNNPMFHSQGTPAYNFDPSAVMIHR